MINLPTQYAWLADAIQPPLIIEGLKSYGIKEAPANTNNPVILEWAKEIGVNYAHDSIPWCGLFMAMIIHRTLLGPIPPGPLWALDWASYGLPLSVPMFGDVLVFKRPEGGHVGIYIGEDPQAFHVLGGNEGDAVAIVRINKIRLVASRRPKYGIVPASVKRMILQPTGSISQNEA